MLILTISPTLIPSHTAFSHPIIYLECIDSFTFRPSESGYSRSFTLACLPWHRRLLFSSSRDYHVQNQHRNTNADVWFPWELSTDDNRTSTSHSPPLFGAKIRTIDFGFTFKCTGEKLLDSHRKIPYRWNKHWTRVKTILSVSLPCVAARAGSTFHPFREMFTTGKKIEQNTHSKYSIHSTGNDEMTTNMIINSRHYKHKLIC